MGIRVNVDREAEQYQEMLDKAKEIAEEGEEAVHEYVERKMEDVFIPPNEEKVLRELYGQSITQDFNDMFHMSEEERKKSMKGFEKLYEYGKERVKCTLLSEYITRWRQAIEVIRLYATKNIVMSPNDFIHKVITGKITINGLALPKFVGKTKERKNYNWSFICSYIDNLDANPEELDELFIAKKSIDDIDTEDIPASPIVLNILEKTTSDMSSDDAISDYRMKVITPKEQKKQKKILPVLTEGTKEQLKEYRKNARIHARLHNEVEDDDYRWISRYNRLRGIEKKMPEFKGNFLNHKDVEKYLHSLSEYEHETTVITYNGKFYTQDEIQTLEFKEQLEAAGWDLRKCFIDREAEKQRKKQKKEDRKKEKRIKDVLAEIQRRKDNRKTKLSGIPEGVDIKTLEKARKKKKAKKNKKKKKGKTDYKPVLVDATPKRRLKNLKKKKRAMEGK